MAELLPAAAGRLMEAEAQCPERRAWQSGAPGGRAGRERQGLDQARALSNLIEKVDHLIIGGGKANTFLVAKGAEVGKSLAERDMADTAREIMAKAERPAARSICPSTWWWRANSERVPPMRCCPTRNARPMR